MKEDVQFTVGELEELSLALGKHKVFLKAKQRKRLLKGRNNDESKVTKRVGYATTAGHKLGYLKAKLNGTAKSHAEKFGA